MQNRITVVLEDITRQRVDAIVNAANSALLGDAREAERKADHALSADHGNARHVGRHGYRGRSAPPAKHSRADRDRGI